jgi:hypothetical protein
VRTELFDDFVGVIREMGWTDGLLYLGARIVSVVSKGRIDFRKYYFVSQPVPHNSLLPAGRGQGIEVTRIDRQHPLVAQFPRPKSIVDRRFANGADCFLATKGDQFIGFLWLQRGEYWEDEVRCRFSPQPTSQSIWDFDVYVEPEFRYSLAFVRLWDVANEFLRDTKVRWSVSRISAFNTGSINSHLRLGTFPIASACFLSGRRWQVLVSGTRPFFHFSRHPGQVPQLRLAADERHKKRYRRFRLTTA